jgi:predicted MFS family arabinose efflux permease
VLILLATGYAASLAAIAAAGHLTPVPAIGLAVAAGLFPPPVGSLMRTAWGALTPDDRWRQTALSLDTVAESTVFALGPVLAGSVITLWSPRVALAAVAALVLIGFAALYVSLRRAPAELRQAVSGAGVRERFLRLAGFAPMLVVLFGAGAALAVEELAVVATWGAGVAGVLMALLSVGGVLGGVGYGRYRWRGTAGRRLLTLAALGAAAYAVPVFARTVPSAAVALILAGAFADTLLVTAYLLVDDLVPAGARTEGGAWLGLSYNLGVALGAGAGGLLVDRPGPGAAFVAATAGLGAAAVIAAGWRSPLRRRVSIPARPVRVIGVTDTETRSPT